MKQLFGDFKKDQVWQQGFYHQERQRLRAELQEDIFTKSLNERISLLSSDKNHFSQLQAFILALESLKQQPRLKHLNETKVKGLYKTALSILEDQQIRPQTSNLSFLHSEVHEQMAEIYLQEGRHWLASWHQQLAARSKDSGSSTDKPTLDTKYIEHLLRLGNIPAVINLLDQTGQNSVEEHALIYTRCLLLSGDAFLALQELNHLKESPPLQWYRISAQAMLTQDLTEMTLFLKKLSPQQHTNFFLEGKLWTFASRNTQWLEAMPQSARIRRLLPAHFKTDAGYSTLLKCIEQLEACYETKESLELRLEGLGHILESTHLLPTPESEILVWTAAIRWLYRTRQASMLEFALSRFRTLSMSFSSGQTDDVWSLLRDMNPNKPLPTEVSRKSKNFGETYYLPKIKSGWFGRTTSFTSLTLQLAQVLGPRRLKLLMSRDLQAKDLSDADADAIANLVVDTFSRLKDPAMKIGQVLSYIRSPISVRAQGMMEILQSQSMPIDPKVIRETIEAELGKPVQDVFRRFADEPLGCGSIGQVHWAQLWDGRQVAVKVQYPDIQNAIKVDMRNLKSLLPLLQLLSPRADFAGYLRELETRMLEECDYAREARLQKQFKERYKEMSAIRIPEVIDELCTDRLLCSEFIEGQSFREFSKNATKEQRDRAGQAIVRFVVSSCRDGVFNSDPHPGNYIFLEDQVVCVDFGSVKEWDEKFSTSWNQLILSCIHKDFDAYKQAVKSAGMVKDSRKVNLERSFHILTKPHIGGWTMPIQQKLDAEIIFKQINEILDTYSDSESAVSLPPEFLYGMRVYFGHMSVVAALGSEDNWTELARDVMDQWRRP